MFLCVELGVLSPVLAKEPGLVQLSLHCQVSLAELEQFSE